MPRLDSSSSEEEDAPPTTGFTTLTKAICNHDDGAGHADSDAKETEAVSGADVEKKFKEWTGTKRNFNGYQTCRVFKERATAKDAVLEDS